MNPDTGAQPMSDPEEMEPLETDLTPCFEAVRDLQALVHTLANAVQGNEPVKAWEAAVMAAGQAQNVADELEPYRGRVWGGSRG